MAVFFGRQVVIIAVIIDFLCLIGEGYAECDGLSGWTCREEALANGFVCDELYSCASTHGCTPDELRLPTSTTCREIEACHPRDSEAVKRCYGLLVYQTCSQFYVECLSSLERCEVRANFTYGVYCPSGVRDLCNRIKYDTAKSCLETANGSNAICSDRMQCLSDNQCEVLDIMLPAECRATVTTEFDGRDYAYTTPVGMDGHSRDEYSVATTVGTDAPFEHLSHNLEILENVTVTRDSAPNVSQQLLNLTSHVSVFLSNDIITAVEITENIVNNLSTIEKEVGENVLTSISQLLDANETLHEEAPYSTNRLRKSLDTLAEKLEIDGPTVIDSPNVGMCVNEDADVIGCGRSDNNTIMLLSASDDDATYRDLITLPLNDMCGQGHGCVRNGSRAFFVIHKNTHLFSPHLPSSSVLSATVVGEEITGLLTPIVITFALDRNVSLGDADHPCVFYEDTTTANLIPWSSRGCQLASYTDRTVTCHCNHMTDFALLLPAPNKGAVKKATQVLTIIGMSLSIPGLLLTMISVLLTNIKTPKTHSRRHRQLSIPQVILSNLALALLLFYTTFLVGSIQIGKYLLCRIFSALSLYFLFVSFGWMLVEGVVHFYVTAIVLCNFSRRHVLYVMIATWGIPVALVVIAALIDTFVLDSSTLCSHNTRCWPVPYKFIYLMYIILVALVVTINCILYVIIIYKTTCAREKMRKFLRSNQKTSKYREILGSVTLFVLLGISWVFGLLAMGDASDVFAIIFCLLNAFQGFFIFILYCIRAEDVRKAWLTVLPFFRVCGHPVADETNRAETELME